MANPVHLASLKLGVETWNAWRNESTERVDLSGADFAGANLRRLNLARADLRGANLSRVDLSWTDLVGADLTGADLTSADLSQSILATANLSGANLVAANLSGAHLPMADLTGADLSQAYLNRANLSDAILSRAQLVEASLVEANLYRTDLRNANLSGANLERATFVGTVLRGAELRNCRIFASSVWGVDLEGATQKDLIIKADDEPTITVDNLEVAQFIYLLLHNEKIRHVVDAITSKVVLILGRFTPERKAVLNRLREELRQRDLLPVLFDFEGPENRDVTETVSTLAHMARFVVADLTDPRSIPQELQKIVPQLPSVPVQPIILEGQEPWGMFPHFERYPWVLPPYRYESLEQLAEALSEHVIAPAVRRAQELRVSPIPQ